MAWEWDGMEKWSTHLSAVNEQFKNHIMVWETDAIA